MHHLREKAHNLLHPFNHTHHEEIKEVRDPAVEECLREEAREAIDAAKLPNAHGACDANAPPSTTGVVSEVHVMDIVEKPILVEKHIDLPIIHEKHIEKPVVHEKHVEKKFVHEQHVNKEIVHEKHVEQPILHEKHVEQPILHEQHQQVEILHEKHVEQPIIHEKHIEKPIIHEKHIEQPIIHEKHIEKPIIHEKHITKPVIHEKHIEQPIIHEKHIVKPIIHEVDVQARTVVEHSTAPVAIEQMFEKDKTEIEKKFVQEKVEVEKKTEARPIQVEQCFEKREMVVDRQVLPPKERIVERIVETLPAKVIVENGADMGAPMVDHGEICAQAPIVKVETGNTLPAVIVKEYIDAPGLPQGNLAPITDTCTSSLPPSVIKETDRSLPPAWMTSFFTTAHSRDQEAFRRETRSILTEGHDEHFYLLLKDMEPHVLKDDRPAWKKLLDKVAFWRHHKEAKALEDSAVFWDEWDPTLFDRTWCTYYVPHDTLHKRDWARFH